MIMKIKTVMNQERIIIEIAAWVIIFGIACFSALVIF